MLFLNAYETQRTPRVQKSGRDGGRHVRTQINEEKANVFCTYRYCPKGEEHWHEVLRVGVPGPTLSSYERLQEGATFATALCCQSPTADIGIDGQRHPHLLASASLAEIQQH